ncbi:thioredoxin-dependent thiol peroxidase [Bacteroidota bacterium]
MEKLKKLLPGMPAPAFSAVDQNGETISLEQFRGKKLVLYFYPKDNTPGCTAEACDLRDHYSRFLDQGYEILGVSADSQKSHQKFISKYELPFKLISDVDKNLLKAYNAWGEKKLYGKSYFGVIRKTFIISEEGEIEKIIENVKTKEHSKQIFED